MAKFLRLLYKSDVYCCLHHFLMSQITIAMNKIKYARVYNYDRTGNLKDDGTALIYIRAYFKGRNKFFPTGISVTPKQWDKKNRQIKNHPLQVRYNQVIRALETKLENFELKVFQKEGSISLEKLADYDNNTIDISFTDFYVQQLKNYALTKSHKTYTDNRQTFHKLEAYRKTIYFNEVNYKLIKGFDTYLHHLKLHINTIGKHHKNLKVFINQAIKFDYLDINKNPYKRFKIKRVPTQRTFLTEDELLTLEKLEVKNDRQAMIRDFFLFCSWTGLRLGDASRLTGENFHENNNVFIVEFTAQKTKKTHQLSLSKLFDGKPERLIKQYLAKYDDFYFDDPDNPMPIFFNISGQSIGKGLKKMVRNLNVRKSVKDKISSHVGRHTFGTIMAGKVPIHTLQKLMQHSNIRETMIYVHLNNSMIDKALDQANW